VAVAAPVSRETEQDAVLEAVFRFQISRAAPAAEEGICLTVRRLVSGEEEMGDPSNALLASLQAQHPHARKGSECRLELGAPATVLATGGPAVSLDAGPVAWQSHDEASVEGGYTRGGWHIHEERYEVVRRAGTWSVRKATLLRIT